MPISGHFVLPRGMSMSHNSFHVGCMFCGFRTEKNKSNLPPSSSAVILPGSNPLSLMLLQNLSTVA